MYNRFNNNRNRNSGGRSFSDNRNFGRPRSKSAFQGSLKASHLIRKMEDTPVSSPTQEYSVKNTFDSFSLDNALKQNIFYKGYKTPTPIQDQAIGPILEGRDVIGIANTGTGKTAAFLIPLINKVLQNKHKKVIIIVPTRELAVPIQQELFEFTKRLGIYSVTCIGGSNMHRQRQDLRRGYNFVIGTPGRLRDLIESRDLNLSVFDSVVLDEADHMVDIGFIHDIKYFISLLPKERQSLFFSATIDGKVEEIIAQFVKNPVTVTVKTKETSENVEQKTIKTSPTHKKIEQLHDLLVQKEFEKVLIFGRTKWGVQKLSDELIKRGFKAGAIHGDKRQNQRLRTLDQFKRNEIQILLATDVASRGLDINNVTHVINYDMPATYDDYVHRIGRTGRADKKGIALTFVD